MRISDWSSDVCSSDLIRRLVPSLAGHPAIGGEQLDRKPVCIHRNGDEVAERVVRVPAIRFARLVRREGGTHADRPAARAKEGMAMAVPAAALLRRVPVVVLFCVSFLV